MDNRENNTNNSASYLNNRDNNQDSKMKNIAVTVCFLIMIIGFMAANLIMPDMEVSRSERRELNSLPEFSYKTLFNGDLFDCFDKYSLDQFVFRDAFRSLKAYGSYYLFRQKDNNDVYIAEGHISKIVYPLYEESVYHAAEKLNEIYERYLKGKNAGYGIIPDKNYFLAEKNGYLSMDYEKLQDIMQTNVKNMGYINLFDSLSLNDYYRTDIHWSQDRAIGIADKILEGLGNESRASEMQYTRKEMYPFYGSYYGQAAIAAKPDTLVYLTNDLLEGAVVHDYEKNKDSKVYMPELFEDVDGYDVYLSGAKALLTITNPEPETDRELILFRDSFGSSIAPLLLAGYSKITLVDLRYISTDLLGKYIDFTKEQDVLFLYNTQILNNSYLLI